MGFCINYISIELGRKKNDRQNIE